VTEGVFGDQFPAGIDQCAAQSLDQGRVTSVAEAVDFGVAPAQAHQRRHLEGPADGPQMGDREVVHETAPQPRKRLPA
jgi:hypothetical protein